MSQLTHIPVPEAPQAPDPPRRSSRLSWRSVATPKGMILLGVVILIAYFALVPILFLLWGTFFRQGSLTLENFETAYTTYPLNRLLQNTAMFTGGATVVSITLGTTLAFLVARTNVLFKRLGFLIGVIPIIIPGILTTLAWIFLLGPRSGYINVMLEPLLGPTFFNIFTMAGMIFVEGLDLTPIVFLLMYATFRGMDTSLEESAVVSGATPWQLIRKITVPLARPGLYAAVLIIIVRSIEAFEVPTLLGIPAGRWLFTSRIWRALGTFPPDYGQAGALSLSLIVLTSVGIYLHSRLSRRARAFQTVTGKAFRPTALDIGRLRWVGTAFIGVYAFVAVVMPLGILAYMSTQPFFLPPSWEALGNASLDQYRLIFADRLSGRAFRHSLLLAVSSATAVMFVMSIASWLVIRTRTRGRLLIDNLAFLPITIPGLVLGVALLFVYLRAPLPIYGTLWILFIAYFTKYMPYGMRYVSTSMYQISAELEESANVSGATWWQTMRRVTIPLLMPGFIAGWMYIVIVSIRELSTSILIYTNRAEVLSVIIWTWVEQGYLTRLAALGMTLIGFLVVLLTIARMLGAKFGVQQNF